MGPRDLHNGQDAGPKMLGTVCFVVLLVIIAGIGIYSLVLKLWMLGCILVFLALVAGTWFLMMLSESSKEHHEDEEPRKPEIEARFKYELHYRKEKRR